MQINPNSDTVTYTLSAEEEQGGVLLNHLQRAVLQNTRVEIINQLAFLSPDNLSTEGKESFWQQEAYLRGQLAIITNLMDKSTAVEQVLNQSESDSEGN